MNYYNENDPHAAQWLRNLIAAGHIPDGVVDQRSITEVKPDDLKGYTQCHFFAGIGGWAVALQLAGWPGDRPAWTGSCPCQPFSSAGKQRGPDDERHLWPVWARLIRECRPDVVFGEQVSSASVVGRVVGTDTKVQELLDREALFGILREQEGQTSDHMQGMRAAEGEAAKAKTTGSHKAKSQELAIEEAWPCTRERGEASSQVAGDSVQSEPGKHSRANRERILRADGNPIRFDSTSIMECTIAGPNRAGSGIHARECPCSALCGECDVEHVGTESDSGDCFCDQTEAKRELERLVNENRPATPEAAPVWFDGVSADLEAQGYAVGAAVLGAHSFGSPHIRQRLFWVANRSGTERNRRAQPKRQHRGALHASNSSGSGGVSDTKHATGLDQQFDEQRRKCASASINDAMPRGSGRDAVGLSDTDSSGSLSGAFGTVHNGKEVAGAWDVEPQRHGGASNGGLGVTIGQGPQGHAGDVDNRSQSGRVDQTANGSTAETSSSDAGLGNSDRERFARGTERDGEAKDTTETQQRPDADRSNAWSDFRVVPCRDGKARRVGSATAVLAHGLQKGMASVCSDSSDAEDYLYNRTGALKGLGNAIVPQVAAEFIRAFMETT